jgi:hypothetical protein
MSGERARNYRVRVTRLPQPGEPRTTDFVEVQAARDVEAARRALEATRMRIDGLDLEDLECHEVDGPKARALEMPTEPVQRPPWRPLPPEEWMVAPVFDIGEFWPHRGGR